MLRWYILDFERLKNAAERLAPDQDSTRARFALPRSAFRARGVQGVLYTQQVSREVVPYTRPLLHPSLSFVNRPGQLIRRGRLPSASSWTTGSSNIVSG